MKQDERIRMHLYFPADGREIEVRCPVSMPLRRLLRLVPEMMNDDFNLFCHLSGNESVYAAEGTIRLDTDVAVRSLGLKNGCFLTVI